MFIRTRDTVKIFDENGNQFSFLNSNRKGNLVKKFVLDYTNNKIESVSEELESKMIPKKQLSLFENKEIKIIITAGNDTLIFQDFKENPCKFVRQDDETDELSVIDFDEIVPDETEIICYNITKDVDFFYPSKVEMIFSIIFEQLINDEEDIQTVENNKNFIRELKTLSNYILYSEPRKGLILNNILVI